MLPIWWPGFLMIFLNFSKNKLLYLKTVLTQLCNSLFLGLGGGEGGKGLSRGHPSLHRPSLRRIYYLISICHFLFHTTVLQYSKFRIHREITFLFSSSFIFSWIRIPNTVFYRPKLGLPLFTRFRKFLSGSYLIKYHISRLVEFFIYNIYFMCEYTRNVQYEC